MKTRLLIAIALLLLCFPVHSQNSGAGYAQINDFSMPFMRSVFWLRSAIPAGSVPILTMSGTNSVRIHTDTTFINTLVNRNDTVVYKLVQIGSDAMLRAFVPSYLVYRDTLNLSNRIDLKLSIQDTTNRWLNIGYVPSWNSITNKPNFLDSSTLYTFINGKLSIGDTAGHWVNIGRYVSDSISLRDLIDTKMDKADSVKFYPMFSNPKPYLTGADTINLSNLVAQKLNKVDTSAHWTPLTRNLTINGVTQNLTTDRFWNVGTLNPADTISLSNRINGKLDNRYIPVNIDSSNTNELQNLSNSKSGNNITLNISNGTGTTLNISDGDSLSTNELQTLSKSGNNVTLSNGGGTFSVADADSSITNEIQILSGSNRTISLTSGGSYTIPQTVWDSVTNKPTNVSYFTNDAGYLTSVNSGQVTSALGYTPVTNARTLTINGSAQDLTANRTWSVGTVTSAGLTAGITGTDVNVSGSPITSSGNITLNIPTASATNRGVLSTTDWSIFNNKQGALTLTTTGTSGAATFSSNTLNIPVYVAAAPTYNNNVSRSLNSNFTISSTQRTRVTYTVRVSYNITILLGSTGAIDLQYSTDGGSTWATVSTVSNSLNLGIALTGYNDFVLTGEIPVNALVRLNSTTTNATNSYRTGQEVLQ